MFGLSAVDVFTLVAYLLGTTLLGLWMGRGIRNTTDFFVGGRRFGKLLGAFHTFGTGTHSDQAVSVAAKTYVSGMSGIWYQWLWLISTPFYWWMAPILRRCRAITTGDYFEARFGRSVALLFVVVGMLHMMVAVGTMLKGSGAIIRATTGGALDENMAIAVITVLFLAYGAVGGLSAAVVTDFVQGLLTIVFSFILLPFALQQLGGFEGLRAGVAATVEMLRSADPDGHAPDADTMWSLIAPGEIGVFYIAIIALNAMVGWPTQPISMPNCNAMRSEQHAQIGYVSGVLIKRMCTVAWTLLGMCAFVMYPGMMAGGDIDQVFGRLARDLLPAILPGLIGIFMASVLASVMSSCDSMMISASALFTHNLYRPLSPGRSEKHYINVGRAAAAVTVAGGIYIAYRLESVVHGLELFWQVPAMMGIPFWIGMFWRRATAAAVWASTLAAVAAWRVSSLKSFVPWAQEHAPFMLSPVSQAELYLPSQMLFYLAVGVAVLVVVSFFTRPAPEAMLDSFYDTLRTPVEPGEEVPAAMRLPSQVVPAPQRKLINHPDWEIQRPGARAMIGFLAVSGIVVAMIAGVAVLVRIIR